MTIKGGIYLSTRERVTNILKEVKPTKNLAGIKDIVEGGYLDSFEVMHLISNLCDEFGVEIGVDDIVPDNFNSVDAIVALVEALKSK